LNPQRGNERLVLSAAGSSSRANKMPLVLFHRAYVMLLVLAPRACLRILKVALTLADLGAEPEIHTDHLAEAISYRRGGVRRSPV
jgi:magnesium chelatase family protein